MRSAPEEPTLVAGWPKHRGVDGADDVAAAGAKAENAPMQIITIADSAAHRQDRLRMT
jgi:hypothetical protein